MKYTNLGRSDLKISKIILGCAGFGDPDCGYHNWVLREEESSKIIRQALELGINCFDTANMYSYGESERILGRAIREFSSRNNVIIASKVFFSTKGVLDSGGLSRKAIMHEVESSLQRLGTDYLDLYQIHRWDEQVPIEETLEALDSLVRAGKVRYIGASSMFAWQFSKALYTSELNKWSKFISMQSHYNLIYREEEREMIPLCVDQGIAIIPWSPLARGRLLHRSEDPLTKRHLTDKYGEVLYSASEKEDRNIVGRLYELAALRGLLPAQIAMAWHLSKNYITAPIVGVDNTVQLAELCQSLDIVLTQSEIEFLEAAYIPHRVVGCQVFER